MGEARGKSLVAKLYLGGQLVLPGHHPIPSPGEPAKKSRKLINTMLEPPLSVLSMTPDGELIIPGPDAMKTHCPLELLEEFKEQLQQWREMFPAAPPNSAIGDTHGRKRK